MTAKNQLIKSLKFGGIGVMPTDTIYGLVGRALDRKVVRRVYQARRRRPDKPLIILISALADLKFFGINLADWERDFLNQYWPGAISVILPCPLGKFKYLHRGTGTLAFRLPAKKSLREILRQTGPLVAPSANPEGLPPASNLREAKKYFGAVVDFYYGRGRLVGTPSTLVRLNDGLVEVLRLGSIKIK